MHPLMMGALSWIEYQQRLQLEDAVIMIPCGVLEGQQPNSADSRCGERISPPGCNQSRYCQWPLVLRQLFNRSLN